MKKILFLFVLFLCFIIKIQNSYAIDLPDTYVEEKQQFRAVWVATVDNLDMPKYQNKEQYQSKFIDILDSLESLNMNALIFQVRPTNDAFYESTLNPWSRYLTGLEGEKPDWNILEWMITETHKRGIEFHAWFNPYRVSYSAVSNKEDYLNALSEKNFARKNPDYVLQGKDGKLILNPGEPAVQQFIVDTVMEVAQNYAIDGIHFDDYFYPYGGGLKDGQDTSTYNLYNYENKSLADWRRDNVTSIIKSIKEELNDFNFNNNKGVQFGISPFGIWANKINNPLGSDTRGNESYYAQYADTRLWVKNNYIDYIVPQVYWEFDLTIAPYGTIVDWWADVVKGTNVNLYIGHAIYKYVTGTTKAWENYKEIPNQILYNQTHAEVKGSVFFSYRDLFDRSNTKISQAKDLILSNYFSKKALPEPLNNLKTYNDVVKVNNLIIDTSQNTINLKWDNEVLSKMFVIYRFNENETININDTDKIISILYNSSGNMNQFTDNTVKSQTRYQYVVTALDYANNESVGATITNEAINIAPQIIGYKDLIVEAGIDFNWLQGISGIDGFGNDISSLVTFDASKVNLNLIGDYQLTYKVVDSYNLTNEVTVDVKVIDTKAPQISVIKDLIIEIDTAKPNWLEYIKAVDLYDGDVTNTVIIDDSRVKLDTLGKYFIIFDVVDKHNNASKLVETVTVIEKTNNGVINNDDVVKEKGNKTILIVVGSVTLSVLTIGGIIYVVKRK